LIHPEQPAINVKDFHFERIAKGCVFDGSSSDYWAYLRAIEDGFIRAGSKMATRVGPDSAVRIPVTNLIHANARYWRLQNRDMPFYLLDHQVRDAILNTDLTWVDADAFTLLPDAIGIVIHPVHDDFSLFHTQSSGDRHPVSDLLLFRVKDPENRARLCGHHGVDPGEPNLQMFFWIAFSRGNWTPGAGGINFGSFPITQNAKLSDFSAQTARIVEEDAARNFMFGDSFQEARGGDDALRALIRHSQEAHEGYLADMLRVDEQALFLLSTRRLFFLFSP